MSSFIPIRSGIEEHLRQGRLSWFEFALYAGMHLQADKESGVWWGSASLLSASAPRGTDLRQIQRAMQQLEAIRFIRTFRTRGANGNYPVLIHKYEPLFGALRGKRLDAWKSRDWKHLAYEVCTESDMEGAVRTHSCKEERLLLSDSDSKPSPPTPPSGGKPAQLLATYQQKHGNLPGAQGLSKERERKCAARAKDHRSDWPAFLELWGRAVEKAGMHPWRDWRPGFDHFIANDTNWRKVLEGQYDQWKEEGSGNGTHRGSGPPKGGRDGGVHDAEPDYAQRKPDFVARG